MTSPVAAAFLSKWWRNGWQIETSCTWNVVRIRSTNNELDVTYSAAALATLQIGASKAKWLAFHGLEGEISRNGYVIIVLDTKQLRVQLIWISVHDTHSNNLLFFL